MKSSWRWGSLKGGCKSFLKVLRTGMTNWADFFRPKNLPNISIYFTIVFFANFVHDLGEKKLPFSKGFFYMFILGSCYCTLIGCSPKWKIAVTAILLVAPQNEQRSPKWTIAVPALQLVAPQNERSLIWTFEEKKPLENGNFCTKTWTKLVKKNCD